MFELTAEDVTKGLLGMAYSLRNQRPEDINGAMATVWIAALERNEVTKSEFAERCLWLADHGTFFPAVGEFLKPILDARPSAAVIQDPVIVSTNELGCDTIGSRKHAEASGLPYRECRDKTLSLPVGEAQRAEALARIDKPITELAKAKRMKAADLIAQDKRIQSLRGPTEEARQNLEEQVRRLKQA